MPARLLILDLIAADDSLGLSAHVASAAAHDITVIPVPTGVIRADGRAVATPGKVLAAALEAAFAHPVDGMLVGSIASYWQARALAGALGRHLPETLVFYPFGPTAAASPLGSYARRLLQRSALAEATVVVASVSRGGELLASAPAAPEALAKAIVDAGPLACWLRDDRGAARAVDVLAWEAQVGLLDCPAVEPGARPETAPAVLAALLALGIPLREAVTRAQAAGSQLGSEANLAIR